MLNDASAMAGQVVYMLSDGEGSSHGPFYGAPGLDIAAYAAQHRAQMYAKADAERADYCWLSHDEFVAWLLEKGILSNAPHVQAVYNLSHHGEHKFVPSHWPLCPACGEGRGDAMPGAVRRSLNRWAWYNECTKCKHHWGHHEVPHDSSKPMVEDDGRETPDSCVPYSISQTTDVSMDVVLPLCTRYGWSIGYGMDVSNAIHAARELGFDLRPEPLGLTGKRPELGRFVRQLDPEKKYIVETNRHWLAVVHGENRDASETSLRAQVYQCWQVVPL